MVNCGTFWRSFEAIQRLWLSGLGGHRRVGWLIRPVRVSAMFSIVRQGSKITCKERCGYFASVCNDFATRRWILGLTWDDGFAVESTSVARLEAALFLLRLMQIAYFTRSKSGSGQERSK